MNAIFQCIFWNENISIWITISLNFFPNGPISNIPSLVQIMLGAGQATSHYLNQWWLDYRHIYVTQPQWVRSLQLIWSGTRRWEMICRVVPVMATRVRYPIIGCFLCCIFLKWLNNHYILYKGWTLNTNVCPLVYFNKILISNECLSFHNTVFAPVGNWNPSSLKTTQGSFLYLSILHD